MKRSWGVAVFCLAIVLTPKSMNAQQTAVTELITAMVTAGFDFNEVDKLRMARLLEQKGVINCQVKEWGKALDPAISGPGRLEFLEERVKEFETKVNLVTRRLTGVLGKENPQAATLARNIARDNDMDTILERVMPSVQDMVNKVKGELKDDIEVTRIIAGEYRMKFESLCQKVRGLEERISILENKQNVASERRAAKPVVPEGSDANTQPAPPVRAQPTPAPAPVNRPMVPDRIVSDKSVLCAAAMMIKKCMDYPVHEEINGRLVQRNYHGDLYSDCHGFILVLHNKTSNTTNYSGGYYQSAPTLAPPIP